MANDELFDSIARLVACHSPSGAEHEIDAYLLAEIERNGVEHWQDAAGNIIVKITGTDASRAVAVTAHKDEIGGIVKRVRDDGKIEIRKLGGSYPWVYGEGVVDLLGDNQLLSGVLSFGSRHVSHESPQKTQQDEAPLLWKDAWVDTKLSAAELQAAGIRPGVRMVVGKHRKAPFRLGDYIASYTLDNKASVAILLNLIRLLDSPPVDTYLVFSAKEEVGAMGAMYFTREHKVEALIALEICPKSSEYPIKSDQAPVLLSQDGYGLYDDALNRKIAAAAKRAEVPVQFAVLSGFGSDGSIAMKSGHVPRTACLSFPTDNTHGYEIAHLGCLDTIQTILREILSTSIASD